KNTAPCIAYISYKLLKKDPLAKVICSPSDHMILDQEKFSNICEEGLAFVEREDALLTVGVEPSKPETGYGYIQYTDEPIDGSFYKVKTFTEKPDRALATTFLKSGDFLWNSGIFLWSVK